MAKKKKTTAKKSAPKPAAKKKPAPAKPAASTKPAPAKTPAKPVAGGKAMSSADLKKMILERKSAPKAAIAFSLDEVREIAKKNEKQADSAAKQAKAGAKGVNHAKQADAKLDRPHKPHHIKPASLTDILGFNPNKGSRRPAFDLDEDKVPDKHRRYFRLLVDLRNHVLASLGEHTEETLLKSAKDDSGDLSGYGQHMADAGTDTFDRDFALSLVSSEQEALAEIEAAIKRIHNGTYGICEITQKPIDKERLLAVPFTRYSAEAKKQVERHSHRARERGGLFTEAGEEEGGGKMGDDADGGED